MIDGLFDFLIAMDNEDIHDEMEQRKERGSSASFSSENEEEEEENFLL